MSTQLIALMVTTDHAVPIEPLGGSAVVSNAGGGGILYYGDSPQVTSTTNQGSIAAGGQQTFTIPTWVRSASTSAVTVTVTSAVVTGGVVASTLGYVEAASNPLQINATAGSGSTVNNAVVIAALPSITFDGVTPVMFELYFSAFYNLTSAADVNFIELYKDGTSVGRLFDSRAVALSVDTTGGSFKRRFAGANLLSGAHVFDVRGYTTSGDSFGIGSGAGGGLPTYLWCYTAS